MIVPDYSGRNRNRLDILIVSQQLFVDSWRWWPVVIISEVMALHVSLAWLTTFVEMLGVVIYLYFLILCPPENLEWEIYLWPVLTDVGTPVYLTGRDRLSQSPTLLQLQRERESAADPVTATSPVTSCLSTSLHNQAHCPAAPLCFQ